MLNVNKLSMVYFVCHYAVIKKYLRCNGKLITK